MKIKVSKTDKTIKAILKASFPDYKGRKVSIETGYIPQQLDSYWFEGSRDYYAFVQLDENFKCLQVHSNHPLFEKNQPRELNGLPKGIVLVQHTYFCGKDAGITIYANKEDVTPLIEMKP